MPTPSAPTTPDASSGDSPAERRANETPGRREEALAQRPAADAVPSGRPGARGDDDSQSPPLAQGPGPSDRAVDADLLIDIPQLTVDELALELEASLVLNHVKLDAKGLDLGLFLKAKLDSLRPLAERDVERAARAPASPRARSGLRELLGATRDAYRDLSDRDVQRQLRDVHASASEAHERVTTADEQAIESGGGDEDGREREHDHNGDGAHALRQRLRHVAGQGVKAAGLTAAGLAGGALLESRSKPSRKLPIPRRRNRVQAVRDEVARLLP
jgi:hypothetical protein